ncbi:MAG: hypothetical protein ACLPX8_14345 [Bryobacteraceae bacterium]|jgi:hypothetical protein
MLNAQRRHIAPCKKPMWDKYTKCSCSVTIRGTLAGRQISLSTAKYLPPDKARDLEAARDLALLWARIGKPVRPEEYARLPDPDPDAPESERPTVEMAVAAYMADGRDRGNASRYTLYRLPYTPIAAGQGILRSEIQIETAVWPLRLPAIERPVTSFVPEALNRPPEIPAIPCVTPRKGQGGVASGRIRDRGRRSTWMRIGTHSRCICCQLLLMADPKTPASVRARALDPVRTFL